MFFCGTDAPAVFVCIICVIMCHWLLLYVHRVVGEVGLGLGVGGGGGGPSRVGGGGLSEVQEGRCATFIKLTVPGSQERLTHCG